MLDIDHKWVNEIHPNRGEGEAQAREQFAPIPLGQVLAVENSIEWYTQIYSSIDALSST